MLQQKHFHIMESQRILVSLFLLLYSTVIHAQIDSAPDQNGAAFAKKISFSAFGGMNVYPA
jgi:hypothetical protein